MSLLKHINAALNPFADKLADCAREAARAEQKKAQIQEDQATVQQYARLLDKRDAAGNTFLQAWGPIENALRVERDSIYHRYLANGFGPGAKVRVEDLASMLAGFEALKSHTEGLKDYLHRQTVGVAQDAADDYYRRHSDVLQNVKLAPAPEPVFVHQVLPSDHYLSGASAALVRAGISKN